MEEKKDIIPFVPEDSFGEGKPIRRVWHNEEWYFSVVDVIEVLTDSNSPSRYWQDLKRKSKKTEGQVYDFIVKVKLLGQDGKSYPSDCANTKGILRIVMSITSPKVEPLKLWLAQVGAEKIEETENPELSFERMAEIYRAKGHNELWIKERIQSITTRNELTDEWKARGVKEGQEYGILTATIAKGAFGLTPSEHGKLKGLDKQNLRDHMTRLELIITSLSEEVTRSIAVNTDAQGFNENHEAAVKGGQVGHKALLNVEEATGQKVVSAANFLKPPNDDRDALPQSNDTPKD